MKKSINHVFSMVLTLAVLFGTAAPAAAIDPGLIGASAANAVKRAVEVVQAQQRSSIMLSSNATVRPPDQKPGAVYVVKGTISSTLPLTKVTMGIYREKDGKAMYTASAKPNARNFNLTRLDSKMRFDLLAGGNAYVFEIVAEDAMGYKKAFSHTFQVKAAKSSSASTTTGSSTSDGVWIPNRTHVRQEAGSEGCVIACGSMLLQNLGKKGAGYAAVKKANGGSVNFNWGRVTTAFSVRDCDIFNSWSQISAASKLEKIEKALEKYRSGVLLYISNQRGVSHGVVVVGCESGTLYVLDPAMDAKVVALEDSWIARRLGRNQKELLTSEYVFATIFVPL